MSTTGEFQRAASRSRKAKSRVVWSATWTRSRVRPLCATFPPGRFWSSRNASSPRSSAAGGPVKNLTRVCSLTLAGVILLGACSGGGSEPLDLEQFSTEAGQRFLEECISQKRLEVEASDPFRGSDLPGDEEIEDWCRCRTEVVDQELPPTKFEDGALRPGAISTQEGRLQSRCGELAPG